ncbi:MAG: sulfotransferase [Gammaproteobacteria bacterium]|nr:sulfotransferase [Gammaproteobacteria bacterium]MBU1969220.1 sulfotransferase [Gammaproteobacteria bacterium]
MTKPKPERNDPCPCGSGKKFKKCCQDKLRHNAPTAAEHVRLGIVLTTQGRHAEAETSFRKALEIDPGRVETRYNLGLAYLAQNRLKEAVQVLRPAIDTSPDNPMAHYGLGLVLKAQGRATEAEACLQRVVSLKPDFAGGYYCLGFLCMEQGRTAEAVSGFQRAVEIEPGYADARIKLGECHAELGRFAEAEAYYRHVLEADPGNIDARFALALLGTARNADENLAALTEVAQAFRNRKKAPSGSDAIKLSFALGRACEQCGDHEKAFAHFLEGNRLKRATFDYDANKTSARLADIMRIFDRESITRLGGGGNPSALPIFVLGMPRSGTTLVEQIIASHPEVHGAGELPDLMRVATGSATGTESLFPGAMQALGAEMLVGMGERYVAGLQRRAPEAQRITDKMPANFLAVGLIHLILPNAKIIHVIRDPVDTCLSCFTQLFGSGQEFSYDLAELGRYYTDYARLMEHWRNVLPEGAFLDVRYEDIVSDQEAQSRRLIRYCGLEWDDACLDFHSNKRVVKTASMVQVRQPIYKSSLERWRSYEKHLGPLFDALGELAPGR